MGAGKAAPGGDYFKVVNGTLRKKSDENNPEAEKRTYEDPKTKEQKVVYELVYDNWTGIITGLERVTTESGEELHIHMEDGEEKCNIRSNIDSGYMRDFMKRILSPQFSFKEPCTVRPIMFEKEKKYFFGVTQNGNKIKSPFTLEESKNPNSKWKLPEWIKIDAGAGKVVYNKDGEINQLWAWCTQKAVKTDPMFKAVVRVDDRQQSAPSAPQQVPPANVPVQYAAAPTPPPPQPIWDGTQWVYPQAPPVAATPPPPPAPAPPPVAWQAAPQSAAASAVPPVDDDLPF